MQRTIKGFARSPIAVPITLLVLCVLAYGLLIPTLGFYWDDWPYAWSNHMFGPAGYPDYVALNRPYSAWIFMALTSFLGEQPYAYHISALLLYWVCVILFWVLLRLIWPKHEEEAFWAALLFTIYPGFLGHPQAIIYNHHFAAMALYLFSLIGMVKAVKKAKQYRSWIKSSVRYLPALLYLIVSQFTLEYFLGWEAVRLVILWLVLEQKDKTTKQQVRGDAVYYAVPECSPGTRNPCPGARFTD